MNMIRIFLTMGLFVLASLVQAQYFDAETGLHYNGARYYDPKVGGYITAEPLGVIPGIASSVVVPFEITQYFQSMSLNDRLRSGLNYSYRYARNNPLRWVDPTGLFTTPWHIAMSYDALADSNFTSKFINEVIDANVMMDFYDYSQTVPYAHWHAMSEPGESQAHAYDRWHAFIQSQLESCNARGLGHALHAVQDSRAGGHKFSTYTGHVSYGHLLMDAQVDNATYKEAVTKSKDLIRKFRQLCECRQ